MTIIESMRLLMACRVLYIVVAAAKQAMCRFLSIVFLPLSQRHKIHFTNGLCWHIEDFVRTVTVFNDYE
jgi:hypothetical protein